MTVMIPRSVGRLFRCQLFLEAGRFTTMLLSLSLLYLVDLFINKLKTKFNNLFYRMILNTKRIHNLKKFPRKSETNAFKSFNCRQEKATVAAARSLRAKTVIVGNSISIC